MIINKDNNNSSFLSLIAALTFQLIIIAKSAFKDLSFKTVLSKFVTRWPSKVKDLSLNRFLPLELFE